MGGLTKGKEVNQGVEKGLDRGLNRGWDETHNRGFEKRILRMQGAPG